MSEITGRVRIGKILTFFIDVRVFSKLENRFGMITGRHIKVMSFSRRMATVPFVSCEVEQYSNVGDLGNSRERSVNALESKMNAPDPRGSSSTKPCDTSPIHTLS